MEKQAALRVLNQELPAWFRLGALGVGFLLLTVAKVFYWVGADAWAAVTSFPPWVWAVPGLVLAGAGWGRGTRGGAIAGLALWPVFLATFCEEPASVARALGSGQASREWAGVRSAGKALRVITLNCSLGNPDAAAEVAPLDPDIVRFRSRRMRRKSRNWRTGCTVTRADLRRVSSRASWLAGL